ncbi:hypothetical protein EYF80_063328 [Liparis tanakae]|uniref:Uncharacterized protein n=1 Tax=Liparis tanakae TaxID=230148 RepID=A0A4Z2ECF7_9TELE|nr:hypothetical protein EYF80_063328 [Liparis tanakae]
MLRTSLELLCVTVQHIPNPNAARMLGLNDFSQAQKSPIRDELWLKLHKELSQQNFRRRLRREATAHKQPGKHSAASVRQN